MFSIRDFVHNLKSVKLTLRHNIIKMWVIETNQHYISV